MSKRKLNIILIILILLCSSTIIFVVIQFNLPGRFKKTISNTEIEDLVASSTVITRETTAIGEAPSDEIDQTETEGVPVETVDVQKQQIEYMLNHIDRYNLNEEQRVKFEYVLHHPEEYHPHLIEKLMRYPEALDFVYNYPQHKNVETTPIDISGDVMQRNIPLFIQWDPRWGYEMYAGTFMGVSGCGPTALSSVYIGLTGDMTLNPYEMSVFASNRGWAFVGAGSSIDLFAVGGAELGLTVENLSLDESSVIDALNENKILVLNVGPGHFTSGGHFIVVVGLDEHNNLRVLDPNSHNNTNRTWSFSEIKSEIKVGWTFSKAE